MSADVNILGLAVLITCCAFIGAINARGQLRMVLSYTLAVLCLACSGFLIARHAVSVAREQAAVTERKAAEEKTEKEKLATLEQREAELAADEQRRRQEELMKQQSEAPPEDAWSASPQNVLGKAQRLATELWDFKMEATSDADYEELQKKSYEFSTAAAQIRRQVVSLRAPKSMRVAQENLVTGAEQLDAACKSLVAYYKAENSTEEIARTTEFRTKIKLAKSMFDRAAAQLR